jgi:uncharacterized protein (TIGR00730 family)
MSGKSLKTIVIFGSSAPEPGSSNYLQAYDLGKTLVRAGYLIANGGYGGTMAGAAQAAKEEGATTTGVTCSAFGRGGPNRWIDKEIRTEDLSERLNTLIELGDAYVVLPGGTGTLLEIAMVWELINKHFQGQRPIIFLSDYWKPVIDTVKQNGEAEASFICFADTLERILQILGDFFADSAPNNRLNTPQ